MKLAIGIFAALCLGLFLAIQGAIEVVSDQVADPPPVTLSVERLEYRDGKFRQHIQPIGGDVITGRWSAKITRGTRHLCGGGGTAPYDGKPYEFDPDQWTGDQCPPLRTGDRATGVWEWVGHDGLTRRISAVVVIGDDTGS